MLSFSKRGVAKFATQTAVYSVASKASTVALENITDPQTNEGSSNVDTAGSCIGLAVAMAARPYTDRLVDRVADWRSLRKIEKEYHAAA